MGNNDSQIVISKKTFCLVLIVILMLTVGSVTLAINWDNWFGEPQSSPPPQSNGGLDIDPDADDWNDVLPPDKTDDPPAEGIKIPGYPSIMLPKDQQTVNVALLNPEGNPCYFTFEIVLKDTGESIYKSKLVPPGKVITKITMSRALPEGEYNATIKISTVSLADGSAMNGANVETVLIVK